jgi:hypothetical protein
MSTLLVYSREPICQYMASTGESVLFSAGAAEVPEHLAAEVKRVAEDPSSPFSLEKPSEGIDTSIAEQNKQAAVAAKAAELAAQKK